MHERDRVRAGRCPPSRGAVKKIDDRPATRLRSGLTAVTAQSNLTISLRNCLNANAFKLRDTSDSVESSADVKGSSRSRGEDKLKHISTTVSPESTPSTSSSLSGRQLRRIGCWRVATARTVRPDLRSGGRHPEARGRARRAYRRGAEDAIPDQPHLASQVERSYRSGTQQPPFWTHGSQVQVRRR